MRTRIHLRHLETFLAIVEEGTLTAAGERLCKSQGAVSQDLLALESELGVKLVDRSGQRIRITPAGESLFAEAQQVLGRVGELEAVMQRVRSGDAGPVRVATMPCLSSRTAILVAELLRHTPKVRIELSQGLQSTLLDMLAHRKVDILIAMSTTRRDVHSVALETEPNFIVLPREHPLANRKSVTADDLAPYPYVGVQRDMLSTRSADYFFQSRGLRADPICESDDPGTLQVLVRQGIGYSLLPQSSVKEAPDLVCLPSEPMTYRQISAICSNSGVSNSVAEVFRYFATAWKGGQGQPDRRAPRSDPAYAEAGKAVQSDVLAVTNHSEPVI